MDFRPYECVSYVTEASIKLIADAFSRMTEKSGVTRIQWFALYYLGLTDNISQTDLAQSMNVKDSSVARLLDRMERDGLIRRRRSLEDKRTTNVLLTKKGEELRETLIPEVKNFRSTLLKGITQNELDVFDKVLKKMLGNIPNRPND